MTLCIAALCRLNNGKQGFVLCTDGRLDAGEWGHSDSAFKVHNLGYNAFGLMSGHWGTARNLCASIEQHRLVRQLPASVDEFLASIEGPVNSFTGSPLFKAGVEVIVTGFLAHSPIIVRSRIDDQRQATTEIIHDVALAGEGMYAAETLLKWRNYDPLNTPRDAAYYLLYEAKRFSENVSSVGPKTRMKLHIACWPPGPQANEYAWTDLDARDLDVLEEYTQRLFIQPLPADLNLASQEGHQSTTAAPLPLPPWPESPGGIGES